MIETINIDHIKNAYLRRKVETIGIVPNLLQDCVGGIVERFELMIALGMETLLLYINHFFHR